MKLVISSNFIVSFDGRFIGDDNPEFSHFSGLPFRRHFEKCLFLHSDRYFGFCSPINVPLHIDGTGVVGLVCVFPY